MDDLYHKLYLFLFNRITDAIEGSRSGNVETVRQILINAQIQAEEMCITCPQSNQPVTPGSG